MGVVDLTISVKYFGISFVNINLSVTYNAGKIINLGCLSSSSRISLLIQNSRLSVVRFDGMSILISQLLKS